MGVDAWNEFLEAYETAYPSPQVQAGLFAGQWTSAVPLPGGSTVGGERADLFADERIRWMLDEVGSLDGQRVLELGPLEGGHTWMLEQAGAAQVLAIEAHRHAFLRCLVVKNLLDLRARFALGDFVAYLQQRAADAEPYDLILASGVLYHMADPLELLALLSRQGRRVFIWTHFWDAEVMARRADVAERFVGSTSASRDGLSVTLHRYEYREGAQASSFCGGTRPYTHWMERDEILAALDHYGFDDVRISFDDPEWPHGPAFAVLAQRRPRRLPRLRGRRHG